MIGRSCTQESEKCRHMPSLHKSKKGRQFRVLKMQNSDLQNSQNGRHRFVLRTDLPECKNRRVLVNKIDIGRVSI